jgi:hypothetical protein
MKTSHAAARRNAESHFTGSRPERERNPLGAGNARSHMGWEMIKVVGALESGGDGPMAQGRGRLSTTRISPSSSDEAIDEASEESFPASDPPSTWTGGDTQETEDDREVHPA